MKKIFFILFITALISCGKMPINGNLDGRWQLMTIDCHENGEQTYPEYTYYDVSLHLMELKRKTANNETSLFFGLKARFQHIDDSLHIQMIRCTKKSVIPFGMNDTIQHFAVGNIDKEKNDIEFRVRQIKFSKILINKCYTIQSILLITIIINKENINKSLNNDNLTKKYDNIWIVSGNSVEIKYNNR